MSNEASGEKLKPCWSCGKTVIGSLGTITDEDTGLKLTLYRCCNCGAVSDKEHWNRRAPVPDAEPLKRYGYNRKTAHFFEIEDGEWCLFKDVQNCVPVPDAEQDGAVEGFVDKKEYAAYKKGGGMFDVFKTLHKDDRPHYRLVTVTPRRVEE